MGKNKTKVLIMYFSLSQIEKSTYDRNANVRILYNKNRHVLYKDWLKRQKILIPDAKIKTVLAVKYNQ